MNLIVLLFLCLWLGKVGAQQNSIGTWHILNFKYNLSNKMCFFGEMQLRSLQFYSNYHYYEFKGGFNFKPGNTYQFSLGLGSYQTYLEGGNFVKPKNNDEIRLWPQLVLFQVGLSYKVTNATTLQIGYLHQFDYRINDEIGRDFMVLGCFIEISKKGTKSSNSQSVFKEN